MNLNKYLMKQRLEKAEMDKIEISKQNSLKNRGYKAPGLKKIALPMVLYCLILGVFLLNISLTSAAWDAGLDVDLNAYWNFSSKLDMMGRYNWVDSTGSPTIISSGCLIGNCLQVTTSANLKTVLTTAILQMDTPENRTFNLWINRTTTAAGMAFGGAGGNWYINWDAGGVSSIAIICGTGGTTIFPYNSWVMFTVTSNDTDTYCYLNGTVFANGRGGTGAPAQWFLGSYNGGAGPVDADFDEMASWNRTLTPAEIDQLYNSGSGITRTEAVSDTAYPLFSNYRDNNGTLINSGTGWFNVTLSNTNGTVMLEINGTNITALNKSANEYNVSYPFTGNGTYTYKWHSWGNGTSKNYNVSDTRYYYIEGDFTPPQISYGVGTENDGVNRTRDWVYINVSWTEKYFKNMTFSLYNASGLVTSYANNLEMGLMSYWTMNENATIIDTKGGHNGTFVVSSLDSPKMVNNGKIGNATKFTGNINLLNYSFINLSSYPAMRALYRNFSFSMWANFTNETFALAGESHGIFSSGTNGFALVRTIKAGSPYGGIGLAHSDVQLGDYNAYCNYSIDIWQFWTAIINDTGFNIYRDGVLCCAQNFAGTWDFRAALDNSRIGADTTSTPTNGTLDEIGLWNRMLTNSEILQLYNGGSGITRETILGNNAVNFTNIAFGTYFYNVTITDLAGNTNWTETRKITLDTHNPNATILTPINNTANNTLTNIDQNFSANLTDNIGLLNATLYIYNTTEVSKTVFTIVGGAIEAAVGVVVNLASGVYHFFFQVFDAVGNQFTTQNNTITIDKETPPYINITFPINSQYYTNISTLNYTVIDIGLLSSCWYSTNGGAANTTITCGNNVTGLVAVEGLNTWMIGANNSIGNTNWTSVAFTLDTTYPQISYGEGTENDGINVSRNWIYINTSWTETNLKNITFAVYNLSERVTYASFITITTRTHNFTSIADGTYWYNVTIEDLAGNINWTETRQITIDTTFPTIDYGVGTSVDYANLSQSNVYVNVSFTELNFGNITFTLKNSSGIANETTYTIPTYLINWTGLIDDNYTYFVNITDAVNNKNATPVRRILLDTTYPQIEYSDGTENDGANKSQNFILINTTWIETNLKNITFAVFNDSELVINATYTTPSTKWVYVTGLPNGTYFYNVTITDLAGHKNWTQTRKITIDTIAPTIEPGYTTIPGGSYSPAVNNTWTNKPTTNFTGNVTDTTGIFNITIVVQNQSGSTVNQTTTTSGGVFKSIWGVVVALADGVYDFFVRATDTVGNFATSTVLRIFVDTTPPTFVSANYSVVWGNDSQVFNINVTLNEINPNITGLAFNGTNYTAYILHDNFWEANVSKPLDFVPYPFSFFWWAIDNATNYNRSQDYRFYVGCGNMKNLTKFSIPPIVIRNDYCMERIYYATSGTKVRYMYIPSNVLIHAYMNLSGYNITTDYPSNISIERAASGFVSGAVIWNQSSSFSLVNNRTINFASIINPYLNTCTYSDGLCQVPFNIYSDSAGILRYSDVWFDNIGIIENSQTYSPTTFETANENFILNFTYDSDYYGVVIANLVYNKTIYPSVITSQGSHNYLATSNINIPLISVNPQNNSFYWRVAMTNTTGTSYYNSSWKSQMVENINLSNSCGGETNILAMNITAYDELTLNKLINWTFKATIDFSANTAGTIHRNVSFNSTLVSEVNICINKNTTFYMRDVATYFINETYATKSYFFVNTPINNITTNLSLYLLPAASSTLFILQVQDQDFVPQPDYYVSVERYYPADGTYKIVQIGKTDTNGQTNSWLEINTVDYRFVIRNNNGTIVYVSDTRKITLQSAPYTIIFTIGEPLPDPLSYLENITGLTYSLNYNQDTKVIRYVYSDTNASFTSGSLIVSEMNHSGQNIIVCNLTSILPAGVLECNITGNRTGSYLTVAYISRGVSYFIDDLVATIEDFASTVGMLGLLGAFFILLVAAFVFSYNEVLSIWVIAAGVFFINLIGLAHIGAVAVTAIIAIAVIISLVLERG